jgi:hypothetical protein
MVYEYLLLYKLAISEPFLLFSIFTSRISIVVWNLCCKCNEHLQVHEFSLIYICIVFSLKPLFSISAYLIFLSWFSVFCRTPSCSVFIFLLVCSMIIGVYCISRWQDSHINGLCCSKDHLPMMLTEIALKNRDPIRSHQITQLLASMQAEITTWRWSDKRWSRYYHTSLNRYTAYILDLWARSEHVHMCYTCTY